MCDPVIGAGLALSAAGALANSREQASNAKRMSKASERAALREFDRQDDFQAEAGQVFDTTLDKFERPAQDQALADATAQRVRTTQDAVDAPAGTPAAGAAPTVVQGEIARKMVEAFQKARRGAGALGKLSARDDLEFDNRVALARSGGQLGDINSMSRGSASLLPYEQGVAANNAYRAPSGFGDMLQAAGSAAGMAGATGWNPFGASPYGTTGAGKFLIGPGGRMGGGV